MLGSNIKDLLLPDMKKTAFQRDLLTQQRKNCLNKSTQIRNFDNESYQEYQFHNLEHSELDLIDALLLLCQKVSVYSSRTIPRRHYLKDLQPIPANMPRVFSPIVHRSLRSENLCVP
jgi:hypothetical protein